MQPPKTLLNEPVICIREVNENLRRVRNGEELTRPLHELQCNCQFKEKYNKMFNIWESDKISAEIAERNKAYREAHKDKIAEKGKAYYEANKNKIAEREKAYYEANKKSKNERMRAAWDKARKNTMKQDDKNAN